MVEYRPANHADAPAVARLHAENWRRAYRGNFRDEYLDGDVFAERQRVWDARLGQPAPNQFVCVAVEGARVVGFVCTFGSHHREWGSFIDNLHVQADLQRGGIGASLMRKAGAWLSAAFANEPVYLFVWERNPARALYERLGGLNSGIVDKVNPGGGVGRYFRIVWERPHKLASSTLRQPISVGDTLAIVRRITGFRVDESGDWVAELECGHDQHVRHNPPWVSRPWVVTPEGRAAMLGQTLQCVKCYERHDGSANA